MRNWKFWIVVIAAAIHVIEEYFYPGGFSDFIRQANPKLARLITTPFAIIINGTFLLLCVIGAVIGPIVPVFGLSIVALIGFNGLIHLIGTLKFRQYVPGVLSGGFFYVPIAVYLYREMILSGQFTLLSAILSGVLGLLYQAVPIGYLALAARLTKHT